MIKTTDCGAGCFTSVTDGRELEIAHLGLWYQAVEGDEQSTAHTLGKLVHEAGEAGCNRLVLKLSKSTIPMAGQDEIKAFAKALREKGWHVDVRFPHAGDSAADSKPKPASLLHTSALQTVGNVIDRAKRLTFQTLLLSSLLVNGGQFVVFEWNAKHGAPESTLAAEIPKSPGPAAPAGALPSIVRGKDAPFLRFGDIPEELLRKLMTEAIEKNRTIQQTAVSALESYAGRKSPAISLGSREAPTRSD